jgi:hypothetical protein
MGRKKPDMSSASAVAWFTRNKMSLLALHLQFSPLYWQTRLMDVKYWRKKNIQGISTLSAKNLK